MVKGCLTGCGLRGYCLVYLIYFSGQARVLRLVLRVLMFVVSSLVYLVGTNFSDICWTSAKGNFSIHNCSHTCQLSQIILENRGNPCILEGFNPFAQSALRTCAIWHSLPHIAKKIIKIQYSITRA